mgnify:CR=1 FL=1
MAYVTCPQDLTKVKSKVVFGLTKRQLICFGGALLVGVPLFFLIRGRVPTSAAALIMVFAMLPGFLLALYEKHGQPLEVVVRQIVACCFIQPKERPYQTNNAYTALVRQSQMEKEVNAIVQKAKERNERKSAGQALGRDSRYDGAFWEETLYRKDRMIVTARVVHAADAVEINTYEQLREIDSDSSQLQTDAIQVICEALGAQQDEVTNITVLKKGMTNRSFLFSCKDKKYIMRIPGEGTDQLINRRQEAAVYQTIAGRRICDEIAYINPENGYKITEYLEGARVCDAEKEEDLQKCMKKLREFHGQKLRVDHSFDLFGQMEYYESLWEGTPSAYKDYEKTKAHVLQLKDYIEANAGEWVLTHIDAVPDNFLFVEENGKEEIRLIDWEYAGMQDPHVDIAMFCIYSLYKKEQVDHLIDLYFEGNCDDRTRIKIYCYIAVCGLLWSNWCEYKRKLGVEFGEYSLRQYRYAKDYYKIVQQELGEEEKETCTK